MARMLPKYIDKNCKSNGEKIIFELLKQSAYTKGWTVLHSLNLSDHVKRLFGEIDFLLLIPGGGIFVMEVKGGDVRSSSGEWHFINRSGLVKTGKNPFAQAQDAMFSLKAAIRKHFGAAHKFNALQCGFCVAFPEVYFDIESVEYQSWQIFDKKVREDDPENFFTDLVYETTEKHKGQSWFSDDSLPTETDLDKLTSFLRGDFERLRPIVERLDLFNSEVKAYTKEQYRFLDSIHENDQCLIKGSAGTGKTMIAMESAIRAAASGKKIFLTCYNRMIGQWMQNQLGQWNDHITVCSLHSYLERICEGLDHDRSRNDFFSTYMPGLVKDIFDKGIEQKFDRLIIDEGQDLITQEYMVLFNSMLKGGLTGGQWEIYGDFERQAIFARIPKDEMLAIITEYARPFNFLLRMNCRNTRQIGEETSLLSGFEKPPFLLEHLEGISVDYIFYENEVEQISKLTALLQKLEDEKLPGNEIVILSPKKFERAIPEKLQKSKIIELKTVADMKTKRSVGFATIQAYKGMESNYVILKDIEDFQSESARSLLYVGMTRAKYGLTLLISESAREQFDLILKNKLNLV